MREAYVAPVTVVGVDLEVLINRALGTVNAYFSGEDFFEWVVDGDSVFFDISDPESHYMVVANGAEEEFLVEEVLGAVEPGDVVWDVGANVGVYSCLVAEVLGDGGRVVAIEPEGGNAAKLRRNADLNGSSVEVVEVALSDGEGAGSMDSSVPLMRSGGFKVSEGEGDVELVTGDSLVRRGFPVPNVVKMDIEGHELRALRGMEGVLSSSECREVFCEVHRSFIEERGESWRGVYDLLRDRDFELEVIEDWGDRAFLRGSGSRAQ